MMVVKNLSICQINGVYGALELVVCPFYGAIEIVVVIIIIIRAKVDPVL